MRTLVWSSSALSDFEQAISYLAKEDATAARLVADRIDAAARQLAGIPSGRPGRVADTYEKSVARTSYVIAYALTEDACAILRIIYDRRHWPRGAWPE